MFNYTARLNTFRENMRQQADLAFFPISADLHYLTGVPRDIPSFGWNIHPGHWLEGAWITPDHPPVLTLPRMTAEFGGLMDASDVELRVLGDHDDPGRLMWEILKSFELPVTPTVAVGDRAFGETLVNIQALLPSARFLSGTELLRRQRTIKSEEEIAVMRRAGEMTEAAFVDVLAALRIGMTELEIVSEVNYQLRKHGSLGESFPTSLYNSGKNHPLIFGKKLETYPRTVEPGTSVLFDLGAIYEGFCYDFGRTVHFGAPSEEARRVHRLVMESQAAGIAALKAGENTAAEADAAARKVIEDAGYGEAFRHRLGHGIGMDVHEPPFLTAGDQTVLQAGMMFTVEPSIMQFEDVSARVEDVVVVREGGGEPLTRGFQELIVIE